MSFLRRIAGHHVTHMLIGALLMGGWAGFANRNHPMPTPLMAGLVQGGLTALITLGLKTTVERLSRALPGLLALWLPPLICAAISATLLAGSHSLAGTPEVLSTMAVPLTVATSYAALYSLTLWNSRKPKP